MKLSLQTQIFVSLSAFAALFVTVLGANEKLFARTLMDQRHLSLAYEVTLRASELEQRGRAYAAVAPRDYASYGRDVIVYYAGLRADLAGLDSAVDALASVLQDAEAATAEAVAELIKTHGLFVAGLNERLGDVADEPRLEWGAQFLASQTPVLRQAAQTAEASIIAAAERHLQQSRMLTRLSWVGGLLTVLAIGLWFWRRVTRRIGLAARRCQQVAEGEFGTRIDDSSRDELGTLSMAFNGLSSRTRVVLGVLDQLPEHPAPEQAFSTLWDESRHFLGHRWQAMFQVTEDLAEARLVALHTHSGVDFFEAGQRFAFRGIAQTLGLDSQGTGMMTDMRRHTLDQHQGRLLRELSRRDLRTLALVLLRDEQGRAQRVLAFAWSDAHAENLGVARFLGGLSRFLGRLLIDNPTRATAAAG